ncbi:hypothetical protein Taro_028392 [Colocasia esculenta]|uniref:CCHC-type domain-containing protein n=1 Tax=Colocasia esculenta TaxID=4460 RepID=A0A843VB44_COLES|nr:hypothetical protein [Colocasia esculenta]
MASRGRRGVPIREGEQRRDEPRREDQGEQQAPAPQGPVLPPAPPLDYRVFMQDLVQAMQTQAHTQAALQAQLEAQALSAACRQEGEVEQYLEEKKASQKRLAAPFQRQERKKAAFQSPQRPMASRAHGGKECWKLAGKCLKCGSSEHRIKDCPRLQQGGAEISTSSEEIDMASRGRRGVPACEGEQRRDKPRREDQGEQQAPAPQGPVLPPVPPVDYGVFMQGLVQAMQMQAHTQAALQAQLEAQKRADVWWSSLLHTRFEDGAVEVGWDEFSLNVACQQEGEMEQYLEEKKASQKRPAAPFQRQERKKAAFQSPQRPVASGSSQVPSQCSSSGKKECPHCERAHGGTECWKLAGKCLKCWSSEHRIKDCPKLQQGG